MENKINQESVNINDFNTRDSINLIDCYTHKERTISLKGLTSKARGKLAEILTNCFDHNYDGYLDKKEQKSILGQGSELYGVLQDDTITEKEVETLDRQLKDSFMMASTYLKTDDVSLQKSGLWTLISLGGFSAEAMPELKTMLLSKNDEILPLVRQVFIKIGPLAAPFLVDIINNESNLIIKKEAITTLGLLVNRVKLSEKTYTELIIPALKKIISLNNELKTNAIFTIGDSASSSEDALSLLVKIWQNSKEDDDKKAIIYAFGLSGNPKAVPYLIELLKTGNGKFITNISDALIEIGHVALPLLRKFVDENPGYKYIGYIKGTIDVIESKEKENQNLEDR